MHSATFTVTADTGPAQQNTAKVYSGIKSYTVDLERQVLALHPSNPDPTSPQIEFDLVGVTTFSVTVSSGNQAVTVS